MWYLPVSELFMLGRRTVPKLQNMQIRTIGDLANTNKELLTKSLENMATNVGVCKWNR